MIQGENTLKIVKTEYGEGTGESYWKTEDGRWWKDWDGIDRTGEEVRTMIGDVIK